MVRILSIAVFLLFTSASFGADYVVPTQTIVGAEKAVPLGEVADLSLSPIATMPPNMVSSSEIWKVYDVTTTGLVEKKVKAYTEGTQKGIFFGAGVKPKRMVVQVFCTYLYVVKDDKGVATDVAARSVVLVVELKIGEGPAPPPLPDPNLPTFGDGKYKLASKTYALVNKAFPADAAMPYADKVKGAKALADSFKGTASAIKAGTIPDVKGVLAISASANRGALIDAGLDKNDWAPFFADLQDILFGMYSDDTLKTPADFSVAFLEIAEGLSAVK